MVPARRCAGSTTLGVEVEDVGVRHSTLDDVFFALTGTRRGRRTTEPDATTRAT